MHHLNADKDRLHVKRKEGRHLLQIETTYKAGIINTLEYTEYTEDNFVNIVKSYEKQSIKY
jgi:hypothetical protein